MFFQRFKGLILISLACSVTAQGSTFLSSTSEKTPQKTSTPYSISVSTSQENISRSSANLTISGDNSKVSVEKEGTVTLVAGKSIILRPGTKISNGSFLYASIEPIVKNEKHQKKEIRIVTVEEKNKIEEQVSLAKAFELFEPYPARNRSHLHTNDSENGCFASPVYELSGVTPEQQRKVAVEGHRMPEVTHSQISFYNNPLPVAVINRAETMRVLRL